MHFQSIVDAAASWAILWPTSQQDLAIETIGHLFIIVAYNVVT